MIKKIKVTAKDKKNKKQAKVMEDIMNQPQGKKILEDLLAIHSKITRFEFMWGIQLELDFAKKYK